YKVDINKIYSEFDVDPNIGLTTDQALQSIELHGKNELKKVKRSFFKVIIAPIINLLIILYLISALAMWLLGEVNRTAPTFFILGFNALVAIIQQFRAEKQLKALQQLSAAKATVIRNGKEVELPTQEIVLGDIVKLNLGDKVPADCRIINGVNLTVDESSLTGESEPVKKNNTDKPLKMEDNQKLPIQDRKNMLFLGTYISSGRGSAIVVKIGEKTELGKINVKLEEATTGDIPLRRKMNTLAKQLGVGVVALLLISIIYKSILLGLENQLNWNNFRLAMINSIDLGMKVMPINLPLLTTIVLITGVLAMAKKGVIVRELSKTESLGRVSIVCSDKTGTLTKNEMTTVLVWTPDNEYGVSGFGYEPEGLIYELKTGRSTKPKELARLVVSGYLNNNAVLTKSVIKMKLPSGKGDKFRDKWDIKGLPTEGALTVLAKKYNNKIDEIVKNYIFVFEYNFDSSIKRMSKVFEKDGQYFVFTKGATEWLLPLCKSYLKDGKIEELEKNYELSILQAMRGYAEAGYRVLAICDRILEPNDIPDDWEGDEMRTKIEDKLTLLGLAIILDPPREDVEKAVLECQNAGITTVMITGDSISTGKAIAKQLNVYEEGVNIAVEGNQLYALSDEDFIDATVYGRVSPEHKQIIVERYQEMNRIVSMSGDGVNDALALSMADCGLAMGIKGTEVAKEAADMVITDDAFSTIVTGIKQGRGLFKKIRAIVYFFVLVSVMEAIILFVSSFNPDPKWAMFDYWQLNLLYVTAHMFPSLGFTFMWTAKTVMMEKPRNTAEIIPGKYLKALLFHMLLMGIPIVLAYVICYAGWLPISDFNQLGIVTYQDSAFPEVTIGAFQSKARTMAFAVIFLLEGLIMPMQIRRM
ncbi:MAG: HAD-IC family P-type ATPase, partial [Candidatus Lokiarchaeota archaeon]|nr:HAD-IC family P-type ATPase [Candidatus Lokiarchaeota archaeon]